MLTTQQNNNLLYANVFLLINFTIFLSSSNDSYSSSQTNFTFIYILTESININYFPNECMTLLLAHLLYYVGKQFINQSKIKISKRMYDKYTKQKKRTQSYIQQYEQKKQLLPFIKPRYIKEEMFDVQPQSNKNTNRSYSTNKYSENVRNYKCQTQQIENQTSNQRQNTQNSDLSRVRYKLKDFYRNMFQGKIKLQNVVKEEDASLEAQYGEQKKINFSFVKRRIKKKHFQSQKKQEVHIPIQQQNILNQKLLYTPVLLNRNFIQKDTPVQITQSEPKGRIKHQQIKKYQNNEEQGRKSNREVNRKKMNKKWRKIGDAILFIMYLKRYNKKFQSRRKRFIEKVGPENIQSKLVELKLYFSQKCLPFYEALSIKYQHLYQIAQKDTAQVRTKKILTIGNLMGILIDCMAKGVDDLKGRTGLIEIIYSICKHGSFSCLWQFHTPQELDICCISTQVGYISADHYLQQSYIIGLVFIKIIIYNIFLKPQAINFTLSPLIDKNKLYFNMKLLANILYEIMITLQDKYLQRADDKFTIGNWRNLTYKFDIHAAQSMTVKKGLYQKNQLISGLIGHNYIKETYRIEQMNKESTIMEELVIKVHLLIKEHHRRLSINCM